MTNIGVILSSLAAVALLFSGPGTRAGWWDFKTGLMMFAGAFVIGVLALLISGIAWLRTRPNGIAAAAAIIALLIALLPLVQIMAARGKPPIHDVSTDLADPPRFSAVLPLRAGFPNKVGDAVDEATARAQRTAYPDLTTLEVPLAPDAAFTKAVEAAKTMQWEIVSIRPADGIIEATATTAWFGFHDDIVVRVRAAGSRSRIDVRSVSRVGRGDAGKNADRIRRFLRLLKS